MGSPNGFPHSPIIKNIQKTSTFRNISNFLNRLTFCAIHRPAIQPAKGKYFLRPIFQSDSTFETRESDFVLTDQSANNEDIEGDRTLTQLKLKR